MEKIYVSWDVSENNGCESIGLDQLECEDMIQWDALDDEEQKERLQNALDELPERVTIMVDNWHG